MVHNDIAMGYSVSNSTVFPGIRYAGRLVSDPPGEFTQGEAELIAGSGSFLGSRWGDYSTMDLDPVDDCTFWYTTMYVGEPGVSNWQTRIGSFRFPSCTPAPFGTVEGAVSDGTSTLSGAHVVVTGGGGGGGSDTDGSGHYTFGVPVGTYSLTATKYGYFPTTIPNVVVADGGDTIQDFVLTAAPLVTVTGNVQDASGGDWPLYAKIVIATARGPVLTTFTDPATGNYSIPLFSSTTYNFHVTAVSAGYGSQQPGRHGPDRHGRRLHSHRGSDGLRRPGYSGSPCVAGAGGLVVGSVLDANTGLGADGTTVANLPQPGNPSTTTFATPDDPAQPGRLLHPVRGGGIAILPGDPRPVHVADEERDGRRQRRRAPRLQPRRRAARRRAAAAVGPGQSGRDPRGAARPRERRGRGRGVLAPRAHRAARRSRARRPGSRTRRNVRPRSTACRREASKRAEHGGPRAPAGHAARRHAARGRQRPQFLSDQPDRRLGHRVRHRCRRFLGLQQPRARRRRPRVSLRHRRHAVGQPDRRFVVGRRLRGRRRLQRPHRDAVAGQRRRRQLPLTSSTPSSGWRRATRSAAARGPRTRSAAWRTTWRPTRTTSAGRTRA